jgi:hypothetical protein
MPDALNPYPPQGIAFTTTVHPTGFAGPADIDEFTPLNLAWEPSPALPRPIELTVFPVWPVPTQDLMADIATASVVWSAGTVFRAESVPVPANGVRMRVTARRVELTLTVRRDSAVMDGPSIVLAGTIVPCESVIHPLPIPHRTWALAPSDDVNMEAVPLFAREMRLFPDDASWLAAAPGDWTVSLRAPDKTTVRTTLSLVDLGQWVPVPFNVAWWTIAYTGGSTYTQNYLTAEYR